jgi:ElaA protein
MRRERDWLTLAWPELGIDQLYRILQLRQEVFVVEQNCVYRDLDGLDCQALHMLCLREGSLLAYQRCLPPGSSYGESSLGRVVVAPQARGEQLGRELVQRGIECNRRQWPGTPIRIGAQAHLQGFYASLGFVEASDPYMEDGIPHIEMLLDPAA